MAPGINLVFCSYKNCVNAYKVLALEYFIGSFPLTNNFMVG